MRTLGDMRFLNDYIGFPWVQGGRDWKGMDCYGLAKMVYHDLYGETLPDWLDNDIDIKGGNVSTDNLYFGHDSPGKLGLTENGLNSLC